MWLWQGPFRVKQASGSFVSKLFICHTKWLVFFCARIWNILVLIISERNRMTTALLCHVCALLFSALEQENWEELFASLDALSPSKCGDVLCLGGVIVFGGCFLNSSRSLTGVRDVEISDGGCLPTSIQPQFPDRDNEGFHNNDSSIGDETLPVCHPTWS